MSNITRKPVRNLQPGDVYVSSASGDEYVVLSSPVWSLQHLGHAGRWQVPMRHRRSNVVIVLDFAAGIPGVTVVEED